MLFCLEVVENGVSKNKGPELYHAVGNVSGNVYFYLKDLCPTDLLRFVYSHTRYKSKRIAFKYPGKQHKEK